MHENWMKKEASELVHSEGTVASEVKRLWISIVAIEEVLFLLAIYSLTYTLLTNALHLALPISPSVVMLQ
jgi:hypothetical protein